MKYRECPKCSYKRNGTENNPEWECPSCKICYDKYKTENEIKMSDIHYGKNESKFKFNIRMRKYVNVNKHKTAKKVSAYLLAGLFLIAGFSFVVGNEKYKVEQEIYAYAISVIAFIAACHFIAKATKVIRETKFPIKLIFVPWAIMYPHSRFNKWLCDIHDEET